MKTFDTVYAFSKNYRYDLSVNINPLGPSPKVFEIQKEFRKISVYPGDYYENLKGILSRFFSICPKCISLGAGLDGLLHDFILRFLEKGKTLLMPAVTFQNPSFSAKLRGGIVEKIPLKEDFQVDFFSMQKRLCPEVSIIFLCHPNNPTGLLENIDHIKNFVSHTKSLVIIDEANIEYTSGPSCLPLLKEFPNIVVMRSFSKAYGLAGMRIGVAFANPEIQKKLEQSRPPFNVSSLACEMAKVSLFDQNHLKLSLDYIKKEKDFLANSLKSFNCAIIPSDSNTLLVKLPDEESRSIAEIINELNKRNCHVVDGSHFGLGDRFFRIAPRTREINAEFLQVLEAMLLKPALI